MVEYSKVNVKLPDSQLNKLKTAVNNRQGLTLRMNIKMFNGNNLPHQLLLTTRQTTKSRNTFGNNISTDILICRSYFGKNILAPLGITAATLATDAGIQEKIYGSGTTNVIISKKEMDATMEIV